MDRNRALATILENEYQRIWDRGERAISLRLSVDAMEGLRAANPGGNTDPTAMSFPQESDVAVPLSQSDQVDLFEFVTERRRGTACRCGMEGEDGLCNACIRLARRDGTW